MTINIWQIIDANFGNDIKGRKWSAVSDVRNERNCSLAWKKTLQIFLNRITVRFIFFIWLPFCSSQIWFITYSLPFITLLRRLIEVLVFYLNSANMLIKKFCWTSIILYYILLALAHWRPLRPSCSSCDVTSLSDFDSQSIQHKKVL